MFARLVFPFIFLRAHLSEERREELTVRETRAERTLNQA